MKATFKPVLIIFLSFTSLSAQFVANLEANIIPSNLNGELDNHSSISLFKPENFDISHGMTMSMISDGINNYSVIGLTNRMTYFPMNNLKIDANITLYKTEFPIQQFGNTSNQLAVSYDAGLTYKPTKNSFLQLRFQKIPHNQKYQTRSPFNMRYIP